MNINGRNECLKKVRYGEAKKCSNCKKSEFILIRDSPYEFWCYLWEMGTSGDFICGMHKKKKEV